jgi:hypothetical protein
MDNLLILYAAPIFSLQLLIDGLLIGAVFALAAYGMALVWGVGVGCYEDHQLRSRRVCHPGWIHCLFTS